MTAPTGAPGPYTRGGLGRGLFAYWVMTEDHDLAVCRDEVRAKCDDPDILRDLDAELAHRGAWDLEHLT